MSDHTLVAGMKIEGLSWSFGPLADIESLRCLWTNLEARSDCSFFLSWDWIGSLVSETSDLSPLLLAVFDDLEVVALALFQPVTRGRVARTRGLLLHQSGVASADLVT